MTKQPEREQKKAARSLETMLETMRPYLPKPNVPPPPVVQKWTLSRVRCQRGRPSENQRDMTV